MAVTANQIMTLDGQLLPFSRDLREALAVFARREWPLNTSVHAAKAWGIPKTTAANLLKGHASDATVTAIFRAGGWAVALPVLSAMIGEGVDTFITTERRKHVERARRAQTLSRDLRGLSSDRDGGASGLRPGVPDRRVSSGR